MYEWHVCNLAGVSLQLDWYTILVAFFPSIRLEPLLWRARSVCVGVGVGVNILATCGREQARTSYLQD